MAIDDTPHLAGALELEGLQLGADMDTQTGEALGPGAETEATRNQEADSSSSKNEGRFRAEVDTSAPFESVKEAVTRFGGIGYWKPSHKKLLETEDDALDLDKLKEQTSSLEKDLMLKERETLEVLKELESTKMIIAELKLTEAGLSHETYDDFGYLESTVLETEKENHSYLIVHSYNKKNNLSSLPSSTPERILKELKQAKVNLTRSTCDIAYIRTSVDCFNKKLEKERISLEETQERFAQNSSIASSLKEELNQTTMKLQTAREANENGGYDDPLDISKDLHRLRSEVEQFKKMGATAKSEVMRTIAVIENTTDKIKTAEIRLVAARKMKKAARAAGAVALAEIKVLSDHVRSSEHSSVKNGDVTLSREEYLSLTRKAREAEEASKTRVEEARQHVDDANLSNLDILKRVEEATEEVRTSKRALEVALNRVEAANNGRVAVEEVLRNWRYDYGHKSNCLHNSTKFKNSGPANHRRESIPCHVNRFNWVSEGSKPVLKPTLSIGQILGQKLLFPDEFDPAMLAEKPAIKRKLSLGQMLSKQHGDVSLSSDMEEPHYRQKQYIVKKKKMGFPHLPQLLAKQTQKRKKEAALKKWLR